MKLGIIATQMADGMDAGAAFSFGDDGLLPLTPAPRLADLARASGTFLRTPSRKATTARATRPAKTPRPMSRVFRTSRAAVGC